MALFRLRLSSNFLILILNLNLLAVQYIVFTSWMTGIRNKPPDDTPPEVSGRNQHGGLQSPGEEDGDDVLVYNSRISHDSPERGHGKSLSSNTSTWNWDWDGRKGSGATAKRYLYLVRHGQYYGNGPYEKHLSPMGKSQAAKTGDKLKSLNITFHRFVASTVTRASETAEIIHNRLGVPHLDIEYSDELREGWPSYPDPDSPGDWDRENTIFKTDVPRLQKAYETYMHRAYADWTENHNELVVVHGNVIAYFVLRSLQLPPERWLKIAVLQGSITLLQIEPTGDVALRFVGDVGFMEKSEWTG